MKFGRVFTAFSRMVPVFFLLVAATQSFQMLLKPQTYPKLGRIQKQYITGWASGYGLQEAVRTIPLISANYSGRIIVLRSSNWDIPMGIDVYYRELGDDMERMILYWEVAKVADHLSDILSSEKPAYLLFNSAYPYQGPGRSHKLPRLCSFKCGCSRRFWPIAICRQSKSISGLTPRKKRESMQCLSYAPTGE